jgi:hypothetical protein
MYRVGATIMRDAEAGGHHKHRMHLPAVRNVRVKSG